MSTFANVLKEYEEYLYRRHIAPEKHIPFLVMWVRRFLRFAGTMRDKSFQEVNELFAASLEKDPQVEDWQLRQALDAVSIYGYQFRNLKAEDGGHGCPRYRSF